MYEVKRFVVQLLASKDSVFSHEGLECWQHRMGKYYYLNGIYLKDLHSCDIHQEMFSKHVLQFYPVCLLDLS